jgi:hypothetical protein
MLQNLEKESLASQAWCNQLLRRQRQEDYKFKARLGMQR